MEDNQKKDLKNFLEKNMSQKEIQEKLIEQKLKLEEKKKVEEKIKQKKIFYILLAFLIILLIVSNIYYFTVNNQENQNYEKKVEKTNEFVKTEDIKIENKEPSLEKESFIQEVITKEELQITKEIFKEIFLSKNFNLIKCYNYKTFQVKPNNNCKQNIKEFLLQNTEAFRFEIIAVIDKNDIKEVKTLSEDEILQEYILKGMARNRVIEASWYAKKVLENEILLTPVNYYLTSKKENKGIVIKAYY